MKKQHKLFTAVAATAFCAVILTACGGQSAAPAAQQSTLQPATYSNTMPDYSLPQNSQEISEIPQATFSNTYPEQSELTPQNNSQNVVYFDDPIGWGDTYVYYWSDANKNMVAWPGEKMEKFEGVWRYNLPDGVEYIIFSNGAMQTRDIPYNPQQTNYRLSSQRDADNSYYVEDWQGNVVSSDRVDPKGLRN